MASQRVTSHHTTSASKRSLSRHHLKSLRMNKYARRHRSRAVIVAIDSLSCNLTSMFLKIPHPSLQVSGGQTSRLSSNSPNTPFQEPETMKTIQRLKCNLRSRADWRSCTHFLCRSMRRQMLYSLDQSAGILGILTTLQ